MTKKLIALCMAVSCYGFSQEIKVKEGSERFSSGNHEALSTTIYENNMDDVMSEWKSVLKDFKNEKVKVNGDEVFGDNILIKDWGNNPVDIYTRFEENKGEKTIRMMVAVDLGGAYMKSSDKDKQKFMEKMMKEFAVKMTKVPMEKNVKLAAAALAKLEDNQKDLEKDNKNLKNDIEDYKNKIKKAEEDIKKNEEAQAKKKGEIEGQKKVVDAAKKRLDDVK